MAHSKTAEERMLWLLRRMVTVGPHSGGRGFIVAWDIETVDDFVKAFPEADKTLRLYLMGPHSSPMLNRTAKRAERLGLLTAGSIGNQDARSYNQRTWSRTWSITPAGRQRLVEATIVDAAKERAT
jgi:hypothetical protein